MTKRPLEPSVTTEPPRRLGLGGHQARLEHIQVAFAGSRMAPDHQRAGKTAKLDEPVVS
jgi:hypothetical protein